VAAFIKLTPAQQDHAGELANLGCTGHSLNLTVDECGQKSEYDSGELRGLQS
jgi:hypothetical protein